MSPGLAAVFVVGLALAMTVLVVFAIERWRLHRARGVAARSVLESSWALEPGLAVVLGRVEVDGEAAITFTVHESGTQRRKGDIAQEGAAASIGSTTPIFFVFLLGIGSLIFAGIRQKRLAWYEHKRIIVHGNGPL